jgi:hypothetical protein
MDERSDIASVISLMPSKAEHNEREGVWCGQALEVE